MTKSKEFVQTTVRLPRTLHTRLKEVAALSNQTQESFIEIAVRNEIEARARAKVDIPEGWGELLAQRFLECLPTPAVIKDNSARIVWCNFAFEDLFDRPREHLLNKKTNEMGFFEQESNYRLDRDVNAIQNAVGGEAREFWEPLTLLSRGVTILFRSHRFVFRTASPRGVFLGDISFDWSKILPGYRRDPIPNLEERLRASSVVPAVESLFSPCLESCPAAIAIKNCDKELVWGNSEYEKLAAQSLESILGHTTQQIFKLAAHHPIVQSEHAVVQNNVWMYAVEELKPKKQRTSLRFPIFGEGGKPGFIGVISAEFRQTDVKANSRKLSRLGR